MENSPAPRRSEPVLRPMRAEDILFANTLRQLAGWNQTERDWHGYLSYAPAGCFVAEVDGRPAGTATTIRYGDRFGWIGMVLVHPDIRRLGVGTRLLDHAIRSLQAAGVRGVKLDATPMGRNVYLPLGFVDEYELSRYEGTAMGGETIPDGVALVGPADLPAMERLDAEAFGAARPAVLESLSRRNPELCLVVRRAGGVAGFLLARHGASTVQVGPWMAEDAATAEKLWQALLGRVTGRRVYVDVVAPNPAAVALVRRSGFAVQRTLTRMYLGENPFPGDPRRVFGISSPEKG